MKNLINKIIHEKNRIAKAKLFISQQNELIECLQKELMQKMEVEGIGEQYTDFEGKEYKTRITNPKGSLKVVDIDKIPDKFIKTKKQADLIGLKKYIKAFSKLPDYLEWEDKQQEIKIEEVKQ